MTDERRKYTCEEGCVMCDDSVTVEELRGHLAEAWVRLNEWRHQAHMNAVKIRSRDSLIDQLSETQLAKDVTAAEASLAVRDRELKELQRSLDTVRRNHADRVGDLAAQTRRVAERDRELERLKEIERVFNDGWLQPIPGDNATLRGPELHRLRELIPTREALAARPDEGDRT